jgi:small-conductance mechanosensitive channel
MTLPPNAPSPEKDGRLRVIDKARLASLIALSALLVLCLMFSWVTRGAMTSMPFLARGGRNAAPTKSIVDLRPWQTAQTLAAMAVTAEETELAHDAERLADHEVDQAFATALRQANLRAQHRNLTGDTLLLAQRVQQLQATVAQDKAEVQRLTASSKTPGGSEESSEDDDLAIAKAQLGLDSDQLDDAQDDLDRATGDNRAQIQAELAAHEAGMSKYDAEIKNGGGEIAVVSATRQGTLAGRLRGWFKQRTRAQLIEQASQETRNDLSRLTAEHNSLEAQANATTVQSAPSTDRAAQLANLKNRGAERQILSIYDDRIQTEQQLARVYERWAAQLVLQHGILLHLILQSFATIIVILICMIVGTELVHRFMTAAAAGQRQMRTLRSVVDLSIQVFGALLILLVIFGWPQQMPTILGLVTAGITIVLQDFILGFFGWFKLMGKNGIRVGDRVEINGVNGEVTEVGLINTTLLEIGRQSDTGLPTGRRISFINSFAIRGQYFNYSTTGQWMWDEITVSLPASANPRPIVEGIQKLVQEETSESAAIAMQEWKRSMHSGYLSRLGTAPVVSLITTAGGFDIQIRYVTRASTRFDTRMELYRRVFDAIQDAHSPAQAAPEPATASN